jgi:hypothetical protein
MKIIAKPTSGFLRETVMKKFLLAILTIAALSGAVLVPHSSPAAANKYGGGGGGVPHAAANTIVELDLAAARRTTPVLTLRRLRRVIF